MNPLPLVQSVSRPSLGSLGDKERTWREALESILDCSNGLPEAAYFVVLVRSDSLEGRAMMNISILGREDGEDEDKVTVRWIYRVAPEQAAEGVGMQWREQVFRRDNRLKEGTTS